MSKIVVRGRGPFPIDMLRFAEAWPADQESVSRIHNGITRELRGRYEVTLYTARKVTSLHLLQRWASFGWHAYVVDDRGVVQLTTDNDAALTGVLPPLEHAKAGA